MIPILQLVRSFLFFFFPSSSLWDSRKWEDKPHPLRSVHRQQTPKPSPPPAISQTGRWPLHHPSSFPPAQSESSSSSQHTKGLFQTSKLSTSTMFWLHRLYFGFLLIHLATAYVGTLAELLIFLRWRWRVKQRRKWRSTMLNVCSEWWGSDWWRNPPSCFVLADFFFLLTP